MKLVAIGLTLGLLVGAVSMVEGEHLVNTDKHLSGPRYEVIVTPAAAGGAIFLDKDSGVSWFLCANGDQSQWCLLNRQQAAVR